MHRRIGLAALAVALVLLTASRVPAQLGFTDRMKSPSMGAMNSRDPARTFRDPNTTSRAFRSPSGVRYFDPGKAFRTLTYPLTWPFRAFTQNPTPPPPPKKK